MVYAGAAWAAGLALAAVSGFSLAALAIAASSVLCLKFLFRFKLKSIIFMTAVFTAAFGYYSAYNILIYKSITHFAGKEIKYTGTVTDFKDFSGNKSLYYLTGKINGGTNADMILYNDSIMCDPGDKLSFSCIAELPKNDYLFNEIEYYKSKGIYLSANSAENINIEIPAFSLRKILYKFREKVCDVIGKSVHGNEAGMIKGMLFGDKSGIDEDNMTMLYRTGIGHVTAVSGLHLVLFSMLISFILAKFKTGRILQFAVSETFMLLFVLCCGASVSVLRAFILMTLVNLAPLFFRYTDCLNSICISVIILTVFNPFVIKNQSFLLSVSGAAGAGVFAPYMTSRIKADDIFRKQLKNLVSLICISLAVTPASIICFGESSLAAPFSNLLITPLCMAAIFISITASLLIFAEPVLLFKLSGILCRIVLHISEIIGKNRFAHINFSGGYIKAITFLIIIFCISTYLIFKSRRYCILSISISIAVLFNLSSFYSIENGKILKVAVLGKSEPGVIIVSKGQTADIIDINGNFRNCRCAAKYLNENGISKINSVVISSRPLSAMSAYDYELSLFETDNVILPSGTYLLNSTRICGCTPKYSDFTGLTVNYDKYKISFAGNHVYADYGNFHFSFPENEAAYPTNTVIYASYDGRNNYRRLENG